MMIWLSLSVYVCVCASSPRSRYAKKTIHAIYPKDDGPGRDTEMQKFYTLLNESLSGTAGRGLPAARYGTLATRHHLITFLADVIFHVTVVHEMHGTKTPSYSLNPQLIQVGGYPEARVVAR
jgi:hypothetical protein